MKLKKREITLNEADSVKDVLAVDRLLLCLYAEGIKNAERKQTQKVLETLEKQTDEERERVERLWEKAKKAQL